MSVSRFASPFHQDCFTTPVAPRAGSAIDPLAQEVSWAAWRLTGATPSDPSDAFPAVAHRMRRVAETLWQPGRSVMFSQVSKVGEDVVVELAVGALAEKGASAAELEAAVLVVETLVASATDLPVSFQRVPADEVLARPGTGLDGTGLIRQRVLQVESQDGAALSDVLARFHLMPNHWLQVMRLVANSAAPLSVRATALPTSLTVEDRLLLDEAGRKLEVPSPVPPVGPVGGRREEGWLGTDLRTWRAQRTIADLRESLSTPLFVVEVAVTSPVPLSNGVLRAVACSITSETDVIYQRGGGAAVAGQPLLLGGFELTPSPMRLPEALAQGLPLHGGIGPRAIRDVVTLTELPVGLPVPDAEGLPSISTRVARLRPVPPTLRKGEQIGRTPRGEPVCLPLDGKIRHTFYVGSSGTGKSTRQVGSALAKLRAGEPVVYLDPHGTSARRLARHAAAEDLGPLHLIGTGPRPTPWRAFDGLPESGSARERLLVSAQVGAFVAAVRQAYPSEMSGPRFDQHARAIATLAAAHGVHLSTAVRWYADQSELRERLRHPAVPADAARTLRSVHMSGPDGFAVIDWVVSKFTGISDGLLGTFLAAPGTGLSAAELRAEGASLLVDLSGLPSQDSALFGQMILGGLLDTVLREPEAEGATAFNIFVDEAQRFAVPALVRLLTEGRKFSTALHLATQSLAMLSSELADAVCMSATIFGFRQSPDSASRLGPLLGVPAVELLALPDLTAVLRTGGVPATTVVLDPYEPLPAAEEPASSAPSTDSSPGVPQVFDADPACEGAEELLHAWTEFVERAQGRRPPTEGKSS